MKRNAPALLLSAAMATSVVVIPPAIALDTEQVISAPMDDQYSPSYGSASVKVGVPYSMAPSGEFPAGTLFEISGETVPGWNIQLQKATGLLTVTADDSLKPGAGIAITVIVTYPDGTYDDVTASFTLDNKGNGGGKKDEASTYEATYGTVTGDPGDTARWTPEWQGNKKPSNAEFIIGTNWPENFTGDIDKATGDLWVTAPTTFTRGGTLTVPVLIVYSDNSRESVNAYFKINPVVDDPEEVQDAAKYEPTLEDITTPADRATSARVGEKDDQSFPEGTIFSLSSQENTQYQAMVDKQTGEIQIIPKAGATEGSAPDLQVLVTYPDESSETVTAKVTLTEPVDKPTEPEQTDAETYPVTFESATVTVGETVTLTPRGDYPEGTTFAVEENPGQGWTAEIDKSTGVLTLTVSGDSPEQTVMVPVTVTYPDESTRHILVGAKYESPVQPEDPTDPTDPVDPVDPSDPVDPDNPAEPSDPTEPTDPIDGVDPSNPANGQRPSDEANEPADDEPANSPASDNAESPAVPPAPSRPAANTPSQPAPPVATNEDDALEQLGVECARDPQTGAIDPSTVRILPNTPTEAAAASGQSNSADSNRDDAGKGDNKPSDKSDDKGDEGILLVNFGTLMDLIMTGLPFVIEMIKDDRIRVPEEN